MSSQRVQLDIQDHHVVMDNGILQVTLSKPDGIVTRIQYNGIDNLLEVLNEEVNRGYWDLVWSEAGSVGTTGTFDVIKGTKFKVIVESDEQVEVSFTRKWNPSQKGKLVPLNIDKRFIMLCNSSGFYSYAIYDHLKEWPPFNLPQTRIVFKLRKEKFQYMAIADNRQRYMPLPDDRLPERSKVLDVPEAVLLVNPIEPEFKGEVDDKYEYSSENQNLRVHGWICMDPPVGFWQITPSDEFRSGGPLKQNLTSHVGPTCLAMFLSAHYSGEDLVLKLKPDEPWKKVFGPVFIYLNSVTSNANDDPSPPLWEDAKNQMMTEVQKWPYDFPASSEFPPSDQRGNVSGRIQVRDRYVSEDCIPGKGAYVGLAPPGDAGSFQRDCKGYQFWTRADEHGYYSIKNIREGQYNLYAWVPGFIGDYRYDAAINITAGCDIDVGELVYEPPRDGPTLWEIGIPDRSAAEFYVPDPNPNYINKLYVNHPDRFRQYGLWERYADLYPDQDLIYTIGTSDYAKDWFFAQVTRKKDDDTYEGTTWQIKFQLDNVNQSGTFKLQISLATANIAELQIRINDPKADPPLFTTGVIGKDNTILRHGIHGLYWLYSIDIPATLLVEGNNTLFLTQPISNSPLAAFHGLMYDYIRLEGPPSSTSTRGVVMDNGILQVTLSKPDGIVTRIQYNGIDNLLEVLSDEVDRGYWDLVWSEAGSVGTTGTFDVIKGTEFEVIVESEEQVEVSFTRKWNPSQEGKLVPLNIDKRFIMLRNSSGFYSYAIYDHLKEWPPFNLPQTRIVFKLRKEKFQYMAIADNRQRYMPLPDDRLQERSKVLDVPEAVLLVNPIEPEFKGEVDDKYEYSSENQNLRVHGWICMDPPVGFWQITPSDEFRSGGPLKQNLTSHVGPYCLAMFLSAHYSGEDLVLKLKPDEPWKKVFGPVFIYLNSVKSNANDDPSSPLWEDAKNQMMTEVQKWPYDFPASSEFPPSDQRGNVSGRIQVRDRYVSEDCIPGKGAYVGLAPPVDAGSFQRDCKGYQFWTRADEQGYYSIKNIREGQYNLYAWVPGFIGDYRYDAAINITAGYDIDMGELVYEPPRDGPTLWEIGIPDRSAAEFYVPDPNPNYINKLYVNHPDRFRQYGLWERYADLYPDQDLIYTIGTSDYAKDWFFAQVTRKKDDDTYEGTTWQIKFQLDNVNQSGTFKLQISLATANIAELQIRINDPQADPPLFTTGVIGKDNTILRHGIHGLYWLYSIDIPATLLVEGNNTLFLTQPISNSPLAAFHGLMYDYIRLEGPPSSTSSRGVKPANMAPNTPLD
ncbi:hypothetical protein GBA52_000557 [Prunus armeniaca]|nr:hypothetical protein GBA52_000557 [Prunus armeniaca]